MTTREKNQRLRLLLGILPFRFLGQEQLQRLVHIMDLLEFQKGRAILSKGKKGKKAVYIVLRGEVDSYDPGHPGKIHVVRPGHYFGERVAIFDQSSRYDFVARSRVVCYAIPQAAFLQLLQESAAFSMGLANILREKQGIFSAFERFTSELLRGVNRGYTDLRALLRYYRALEPALHPLINDTKIDTSALLYAVRRLPDNVTRNFAYLLTDDLPTEFRNPDEVFQVVPTAARRRDIWEMMPGKSMVMLRSGFTDMLDFITCLLIYANEAAKIRLRLHNPQAIHQIDSFLQEHFSESMQNCSDCRSEFLEGLTFSREEIDGLLRIWPDDIVARIGQILRHREVISLNFRRQVLNYHSLRSELWTHQIANATQQLFGCEPANLPADLEVHIVSSNSHSVTNCLNPLFSEYGRQMLDWAREHKKELLKNSWEHPFDLLYALGPDFFAACPDLLQKALSEIEYGVMRLHNTASTGIQVQLIDTGRLENIDIDPGIVRSKDSKRKLIVNIDYAFGEQAEDIIRNLVLLFGPRIRSVNVMGKAGSLVGKRGDILLASSFIEQTQDQFFPLDDFLDITPQDLQKRLPGRTVYNGPILTVAGTLLQNRMMLKFYRHLWNCIGLEMEGTWYHRQILEARQLGVIPDHLQQRYMYYVSDLPMQKEQNLSASLSLQEGIPPLYAITREILERIL